MNVKRYIMATFALFIFIVLHEGFVHGFLLNDLYEKTSNVWRPFQEIDSKFFLGISYQFVISAWAAFVFTQIFKDGGIRKGLFFGFFFGIFAGILSASWYIWLPIPATLAWGWFLGAVIEGLIGGSLLGLIYKQNKRLI